MLPVFCSLRPSFLGADETKQSLFRLFYGRRDGWQMTAGRAACSGSVGTG